jgi:acyl carrier protein
MALVMLGEPAVNTENFPAPQDDPVLRETLKRCSPATYYAACKFRQTGAPDDLRLLVAGVVERFVERSHRTALAAGGDALRLREDLGLDSLTMMEIVMLAEEVLPLTVANEELTSLRTLGDVQAFIARKLAAPRATPRPALAPAGNDWDLAVVGDHIRKLEADAAARALNRGAH